MAKMYSKLNRRKTIYQPNLSRNRQPYAAPIPSEFLNLFYDQFVMDVARLRENINDINSKIEEIIELRDESFDAATPGYYLNNDILFTVYTQEIKYNRETEEYELESATPYYESPLSFYKPAILSSKILVLEDKLNFLEKTINVE